MLLNPETLRNTAALLIPEVGILLHEDGDIAIQALGNERFQPLQFHGPETGTAFTAGNDPVNAGQVNLPEVIKHWLDADKCAGRGGPLSTP